MNVQITTGGDSGGGAATGAGRGGAAADTAAVAGAGARAAAAGASAAAASGATRLTTESYLSRFAEPDGYLDFARFGPVSSDVAAVLERAATTVHTQGWGALDEFDDALRTTAAAGAVLLGCAPGEVGVVSSTSHGLAAAAFGLRGPGAVVVSRSDFPAAVYPWLRAAERGGLEVRFVDGSLAPDRLRPLLDASVRAVAVCAVDAASGFVAPLGGLKELIGPRRVLVVDAVQALGAVPVEAEAADVVACGGQKWLRSGWGAALLLVRERVADLFGPGIGGWAGVADPIGPAAHPHAPLPGGAAYMFTNPDGPAVAALGAGLRLVLDAGTDRISALIGANTTALVEAARAGGAEVEAYGSGIARLRMPGVDPAAVHVALSREGLTTTLRDDWIRVSPHASTKEEAADQLVAALRSIRRRA